MLAATNIAFSMFLLLYMEISFIHHHVYMLIASIALGRRTQVETLCFSLSFTFLITSMHKNQLKTPSIVAEAMFTNILSPMTTTATNKLKLHHFPEKNPNRTQVNSSIYFRSNRSWNFNDLFLKASKKLQEYWQITF